MLSKLLAAFVGALGRVLTSYLADKRAEAALKKLGKLEEQNNVYRQREARDAEVRKVLAKLSTDPDYAQRVRDRFTTS